ncbi:NADH:flavin oxidoreductase/NADH oxidase [Texcoconibacillus texcoconensis]|uniref:2,4-dienoyl-CoA reductase-like NADH-dependent reductase (Old Yellow Enzyme family) n=1 Tax=Texcoconibacillus texcoconensis TaxID=1095777 RepID=A0A840QTG7_9BACI|nr:NADH:flavin oxidoreductase/NADH oxidase [Texcoconibacillus texcoconensis]MBB5174581.1 2,4-dienoyl-CoA reductase-like NADH-dependent reductase (Old Yellow Enzyme family) [Texcoconibacillus texcoconensis]
MTNLFSPIQLKGVDIPNRIMLSPMCQYQVKNNDGMPNDWHYIHLTSRAIGGVGLICLEMTNIEARGRITENCLGLWEESQLESYKKIIDACKSYGSKVAVQIAHAGRKSKIASGDVVAPSEMPFSDDSPSPRSLETQEIKDIVRQFGKSTELAVKAGFDMIELHGAHGYLLHQFISPSCNKREDEYSEYDRFPLEVIKEVRNNMPDDMPLILRISAIEYGDGAYDFHHIKQMIPAFIEAGVDAFDVSTGGNSPQRPPEIFAGFQVKYAEAIKQEFDIPVISVGSLEDAEVAQQVIEQEQADMVAIGRGLLRYPYWPKEAAEKLGLTFNLPGVYDIGY